MSLRVYCLDAWATLSCRLRRLREKPRRCPLRLAGRERQEETQGMSRATLQRANRGRIRDRTHLTGEHPALVIPTDSDVRDADAGGRSIHLWILVRRRCRLLKRSSRLRLITQ